MAKADSEGLARSIAEEQLTDVEKEKTVLELEIKELMNRHKTEISKKEHLIQIVRYVSWSEWLIVVRRPKKEFHFIPNILQKEKNKYWNLW